MVWGPGARSVEPRRPLGRHEFEQLGRVAVAMPEVRVSVKAAAPRVLGLGIDA